MGVGPARNGGGSFAVNTNLVSGQIYGQPVTEAEYDRAAHDVDFLFLFRSGRLPQGNPATDKQLLQQIYLQIMFLQKAKQLDVHVSDDQAAQAAADYLSSPTLVRALGVHGDSVPFDVLKNQILPQLNLTEADFENFVRDDLAIRQLQSTFGLPGQLVTPLEATNEYILQNQEFSAQIVFFSASNYLDHVRVSPNEVGLFYTNYMAEYRLPDRVQVSYVFFSVSNYLTQAEEKLAKTNLDGQVEGIFARYGMQVAPDAKTPEEAKAHIREILIRQEALGDAEQQANDFAQAVFNLSSSQNRSASPDDLTTEARKKGLKVHMPAPFSADYGPQDFIAPPAFTRQAFELTPDSPIPEPVVSPEGVYVMALITNLPSEIPPLSEIHGQVTRDLELREATFFARRAGTNFVRVLGAEMARGKSFAAASVAAGYEPQVLPPFSMTTDDLPELADSGELNEVKEAAFTTRPGFPSNFEETDDGGFVIYIESRLPIDSTRMDQDMPEFMARLREQGAQAAFNDWYEREANNQLRGTPLSH